jgi:dephospho-CoA kinase
MKIVGLTGGIGSGKSSVLNQFKNLGINTYSADNAAKKLINSDKDLIKSIKNLFGDNIYENNILDSVKLSKIVFKDPYKLKSLNSIIHPAVAKDFESFIKTINGDYIVKEVAIIFETNTEHNYNKIILVRAPLEERIKRVILRDNLSREDVIKRVNNQIDDSTIIDNCDYIIENINLKDLKEKVLKIHIDLIR